MIKLKELIGYFLGHAPHKLNKTEMVKMIYMFEYYNVQTFGNQYTNLRFIRYKYGPYANEINLVLDEMINIDNIIREDRYAYSRDYYSYSYSLTHNNINNIYTLDNNVVYIADFVIGELSNKNHDELLKNVYSTPPMVKILKHEKQVGSKQYREELDMNECQEVKRFSRENIEKARERLDKSSSGTDEEYYKTIMRENEELEDFKRRANYCLLK